MLGELRIEYPGATHHVLDRGDQREDIFLDEEDRRRFLGMLEESCGETDWQMLRLNSESNAAPVSAVSIELDESRLLSVLELYGQFSGRTLLYWPALPSLSFSWRATCRSRAEAAQLLKEALAKRGVVAVRDGEKFEMIVPSDQVTAVKPRAPKAKPREAGAARPEEPPTGVIDFYGVELVQAFEVYAAMVGGRFDETAPRPAAVQPFIYLWIELRDTNGMAAGSF
jgi:hypothetical protein